MSLDIIDSQTVYDCISMEAAVPLMTEALQAPARGAVLPPRVSTPLLQDDQQLLLMPGALPDPAVVGVKTLTLFPANTAQGRPAIQGLISLFDANTGAPVALVDAASITAIRTAAATAAATQVLANPNASTLALIGTGVQAATHLQAMMAIRPIDKVRVWGRSFKRAQALVDRIKVDYINAKCSEPNRHIVIEAVADISSALSDADIVCTLTGSATPLVLGRDLSPGAHINLVGSHSPEAREVDTETIQRARLFVELKSAALREAGDILIPLKAGEIEQSHMLGEIAEVLSGEITGRQSLDDITAYKSLGNATQDLVMAHAVWVNARHRNRVQSVAF